MALVPSHLPKSLVLAGAGKMGGSMLEGWLAAGLSPAGVTVIDPHVSDTMAALCAERRIALNPPAGSVKAPAALILAIKPQMLDQAAPMLEPLAGLGTTIISILAGKTIADLQTRFPAATAFVRAMPNLPASIGKGATGAYASAQVSDRGRAMANDLLSASGIVEWVEDEGLIDAVTAVSGSGPAYVFLLAEELAKAGTAAGLPQDLAHRLARATVAGAGALLDQSELPAEQLRKNVTSPAGTTAAALDVLMGESGLEPLLRDAVAAAKRRAAELSG
jgi:pyrroline-5-carboxylate reductase